MSRPGSSNRNSQPAITPPAAQTSAQPSGPLARSGATREVNIKPSEPPKVAVTQNEQPDISVEQVQYKPPNSIELGTGASLLALTSAPRNFCCHHLLHNYLYYIYQFLGDCSCGSGEAEGVSRSTSLSSSLVNGNGLAFRLLLSFFLICTLIMLRLFLAILFY